MMVVNRLVVDKDKATGDHAFKPAPIPQPTISMITATHLLGVLSAGSEDSNDGEENGDDDNSFLAEL